MRPPVRSVGELCQFLRTCADQLESDPNSSYWPRVAKEAIDDWLVHAPPDGAVVELFTLSLLIDHLLTVLTGDVVYELESRRLRDGVFALVPATLRSAADAVLAHGNDAHSTFLSAFGAVVSKYLGVVREINVLLEQHK